MTIATAGHPVALPRVSVYEAPEPDVYFLRVVTVHRGRLGNAVMELTECELRLVAEAAAAAVARIDANQPEKAS